MANNRCSTLLCGGEPVWFKARFDITVKPGQVYQVLDCKCETCYRRNVISIGGRSPWTQIPPTIPDNHVRQET